MATLQLIERSEIQVVLKERHRQSPLLRTLLAKPSPILRIILTRNTSAQAWARFRTPRATRCSYQESTTWIFRSLRISTLEKIVAFRYAPTSSTRSTIHNTFRDRRTTSNRLTQPGLDK